MKKKYLVGGLASALMILASCSKKEVVSEPSSTSDKPAEEVVAPPVYVPETVIAQELEGKTHIMKDGEYVSTELKNADYYLLYFTASW